LNHITQNGKCKIRVLLTILKEDAGKVSFGMHTFITRNTFMHIEVLVRWKMHPECFIPPSQELLGENHL